MAKPIKIIIYRCMNIYDDIFLEVRNSAYSVMFVHLIN